MLLLIKKLPALTLFGILSSSQTFANTAPTVEIPAWVWNAVEVLAGKTEQGADVMRDLADCIKDQHGYHVDSHQTLAQLIEQVGDTASYCQPVVDQALDIVEETSHSVGESEQDVEGSL